MAFSLQNQHVDIVPVNTLADGTSQEYRLMASLSFYLSFGSMSCFTSPPSPRPGVPLGPETVRRGGGRTSTQEQQTDDRHQRSGRTLCGRVLLSTLGEYRK